ncbi:MAG: sulfotransferase [Caldilineaceae bacterium]
MTMPNFLIIGAPKCGTTALYAALKEHPQIFMSAIKEPRFFTYMNTELSFRGPGGEHFNRTAITDLERYQALFAAVCDESAIGEASTDYLSYYQPEQTAENIRRYLPQVRLIALLRQPVERAYSGFHQWCQEGNEPLADFRAALAAEPERLRNHWLTYRYRGDGCYFANLKPYFERFDCAQIRVYLYEEWNSNPKQVLQDIFGFLGVANHITPAMLKRHNETLTVRNQTVERLLRRSQPIKHRLTWLFPLSWRRRLGATLKRFNQTKVPALAPQIRYELTALYRTDILQLQDLIGRDLSHWLEAGR